MAYSKTTWKNRVVQNPQTYLQQQNTDGTVTLIPKEGTVTETGTPVNAVNMNNIENGISTLDAQNSIYNAGGTANAITVATTNGDYSYAQFKRLSIKVASDNTGNVTINVDGKGAVPALKYDKNQIPAGGIKAGKLYDFYYDTANACFFLIAKASGNAVAADVLAGKTFSNDTDSGLVGTLIPLPTPVAGDYIIASNIDAQDVPSSGKTVATFTSKVTGTVRISYTISAGASNMNCTGEIDLNGTLIKCAGTYSTSPVTFTIDQAINKGDIIEIKAFGANIVGTYYNSNIGIQENPFFD